MIGQLPFPVSPMSIPQAPESDAQGPLEILFEIQEWFKNITGLPGVTTQPVAGAQGRASWIKAVPSLSSFNPGFR